MYLDVFVPPYTRKSLPVDTRANAMAYIFEGEGRFVDASNPIGVQVEKEFQGQELNIRDLSGNRTMVKFSSGDTVTVDAGPNGIRFLLITGRPLQEPVAWHGPIVMNTQEELRTAIKELKSGDFIKQGAT